MSKSNRRAKVVDDFAEAMAGIRFAKERTVPVPPPTNVVSIRETPVRVFTDEHLSQMLEMVSYDEGRKILRRGNAAELDYTDHHRLWFRAWTLHVSYVLDQNYGIGETLADRYETAKAVLNQSAPAGMREPLLDWLEGFYERLKIASKQPVPGEEHTAAA